ncbi:helix-turn-helix transcriptional regulator [Spirillospora sp. NPDC049024]
MDNRHQVREFLMSRRAKVTPAQAGLPAGRGRRVPGLRRSEVAMLAGVSVEYYSRLERGAVRGASAAVLNAIADTLRLDDAERAHLFDLARTADGVPASGRRRRRATGPAAIGPGLAWSLEAITGAVAFIRNPRMDVLAVNTLGRAFYSPLIGGAGRVPNLARFLFLDPASRDFYPDWDRFARMSVAIIRAEAGRDPDDRDLQELVGELSTRSRTFRGLWGAHDVSILGAGTKRFRHPDVGELVLAHEELAITAEPGLMLMIYTAEPGSASAERLRLLGSLATEAASTP